MWYSSTGSGAPPWRSGSFTSNQRRTCSAQSPAIPASAPIRARTSPELARQPLQVRLEHAGRLPALGVEGVVAEATAVARKLVPERGQRRLARRVDEERREVVQHLVADRPFDRPIAQLLAGVEDLLDPGVLDALGAQP